LMLDRFETRFLRYSPIPST